MKTLQYYGSHDIRVKEVGKPMVTDPKDVVVRVTSTAICGSDLHMYTGNMPGMKHGDILGHEFMGFVEDVGPEVRSLSRGDRVVVAFDIACGSCFYCKRSVFSSCDSTNPSKEQEVMYGHHTAGIFGYSHLTGGWDGGQAEWVRVPFADNMCLKVPHSIPDDDAVLLSDILPTAWHANEMGEVKEGDNVAIWGSGPVGVLAAHCAFQRGANRVVLIDQEAYRLAFAQEKMPRLEVINFREKAVKDALHEMFQSQDGHYIGPDVCIEAVGFHYANSWLHWAEMTLKLETDPSEILNQLIAVCRKGGRLSIVGVYAGYTNHFNIGAFMEKGLRMTGGQTPVQKYWKHLLHLVEEGQLTPSMVVTHHMPLEEGPKGYKIFNDKDDRCMKVVLKPGAATREQ